MNSDEFMEYVLQEFGMDQAAKAMIRNIIDYARCFVAEEQQDEFLLKMLDGTGLPEHAIRMIIL